jgi:hypothetical protein
VVKLETLANVICREECLIKVLRANLRSESRGVSMNKLTARARDGGVSQVVKHLLCMCKTLSSNPSPNQKKKKVYGLRTMARGPKGRRESMQ